MAIKRAFESEPESSEDRVERLKRGETTQRFWDATERFRRHHGLTVTWVTKAGTVPQISSTARFKYRRSFDEDAQLIKKGHSLAIAAVYEGKDVIGYGIARMHDTYTEIQLLDVDVNSRRRSGLSASVRIGRLKFSIGVAHIVVRTLIRKCHAPLRTDATTDSSRYVFKSLGFVNAEDSGGNPCLLELAVKSDRA